MGVRSFAIASLALLCACGGGSTRPFDYRVALDPTWAALELPGREASLRAFSIDLIEAIGKKEGLKIGVFDRNWDSLVAGLQGGNYEAIASTMQPYLFYGKTYDFSDVYLQTGPVLIVPVGAPELSLEGMANKEIAVIRGSSSTVLLEKYPGVIQRIYESAPQALNDTVAGVVDGAILDILTAEAYCRDLYEGQLRVVMPALTDEGLRLITLHDKATGLIEAFNRGLRELKESGVYADLVKKWALSE